MPKEPYRNPSQIAFKKFEEKISEDQNISHDIMTAILDDISSENPQKLNNLVKAIAKRGEGITDDSDKIT